MAAQTDFEKLKLSGSTDGLGIKLTQTATGTEETIHTSHATALDEVWIWAVNNHTAAVEATLEWGGVTDPDHTVKKTIPKDDGPFLLIPGFVLTNSKVIKAFAGTADVITLFGFVNRMS